MNSHPRSHRERRSGRFALKVGLALVVLAGLGLGGVALADRRGDDKPAWQGSTAAPAPGSTGNSTGARPESAALPTVTLSATGDIMMASAPGGLPPRNGAGFFDSVRKALASDLVMGNLEQPLTEDTGTSKCGSPPSPNCFAFRSPPSYAEHLADGGFQLLNTANNHAKDFGAAGFRNTIEALEGAGLRHTGAEDQITVVETKGVKVAVVGFSPYAGANDLNDLTHARAVVKRAAGQADLVVVQAHMGAEGASKNHVEPGSESFFGENRGDPIKFSHTVIDAGADLVIGHGPHVLRGMEFYRGKLIAYSLGNFAGGGRTLSKDGILKYAGVLRVTLTADGSYAGGRFLSTYMNSAGLPTRDTADERGRELVADLTAADFPESGATIGADGTIKPAA
ncbi:CapA family protein [Actinoplanes teichomyceticus]|uniref:Poly-gamma-glutamate capsule biosynthesis protein CapA/YwtB (Metallophosphatase superfamily) n=1 Tax=Actinoplanes teichomyceticus TaxID=1867 RepID=A0A561WQM1_ACTTI|nr:CapA family protein [Actinoplanes teichomyceticus]TWG26162.1 poly-gamma-glutamate capsule biosynthesis protein CapA/YwtB (metallophosphatase superfamily) [Actinoplanes teichomyceticus]GIF11241.1 metallophosphatase [Actinoplanes teichomyceticus]